MERIWEYWKLHWRGDAFGRFIGPIPGAIRKNFLMISGFKRLSRGGTLGPWVSHGNGFLLGDAVGTALELVSSSGLFAGERGPAYSLCLYIFEIRIEQGLLFCPVGGKS